MPLNCFQVLGDTDFSSVFPRLEAQLVWQHVLGTQVLGTLWTGNVSHLGPAQSWGWALLERAAWGGLVILWLDVIHSPGLGAADEILPLRSEPGGQRTRGSSYCSYGNYREEVAFS